MDRAWGPFLFDTSSESWLERTQAPLARQWMIAYLSRHQIHVSAITVAERIRGYTLLWRRAPQARRVQIEASRVAYLRALGRVLAVDAAVAVLAGEIMSLLPDPPTPPHRSHRIAESRQERLSRWRFDCIIAATALHAGLPLVHENPADFEAIRAAIECSPERFPAVGSLRLIRFAALY